MSRRRLILVVCVLTLLGAGGYLALWLTASGHQVNEANTQRIRPGMSQHEVEAILGGPPGDYRTGDIELDLSKNQYTFHQVHQVMTSMEVLLGEIKIRNEWWQGNEGTIWVCFNGEGRALTKQFIPGQMVSWSIWERLRHWLGIKK